MDYKRTKWTESEILFIQKNYKKLGAKQVSEILNRSPKSVRTKAERICVRILFSERAKNVEWSESEKEIIRNNKFTSIRELEILLPNRTGTAIKAMRHKLRCVNCSEPKLTSRGYKYLWHERRNGKKKIIFEHRKVVEDAIGRELKSSEQVHHIDFNKLNNEIENLYLCENAVEHRIIHHSIEPLISQLLERGIIRFNRNTKKYELCQN